MRALLAAATGALAFAAVVAAGLLASRAATERLRDGASAELAQAARHLADTLDRGMFERWRDVQIAAAHPVLREPAAPSEAKREALSLLERTYPDYAISVLVGTDGRVEVTSRGILEGADVSGRAYFLHGRAGPFAGDVHEALLMATHLAPRPNGEPARFVDLAAPVTDPNGRPAGVLAVHLYWDWAEGVERDVLQPLRERSPGTDALVLAQDGTVLLGPAGLRGVKLAALGSARAAGAGRTGALRERWTETAAADGSEDLVVGHAPTRGHRGYPGLGWSVLVRQDAASAFAPAEALRREILLWAAAVALAAAAAAWLLAHAATRPVRALTAIADRLAQDPDSASDAQRAAAQLGRGCLYREGAALGAAMAGMIGSQRRAAVVLAAEEARLRAVLERMPVGVVLAEAPTGRVLMRNRRAEEIAGGGGALFDPGKGRALATEEYPLARAARDGRSVEGEVFLLRRKNGAEAWLDVSAARLADPAGGLLAIATVSDISGRKAAERERELLIRELNHRVKNMLATVQALAAQTMREPAAAAGAADFVQAFGQRLRALARAHDLIAASAWEEAELAAVAETALAPLLGAAGSERIRLAGPAAGVQIGPREAQALALALHELATNALKHGALSVPGGAVSLGWGAPARPGERVALEWVESGGPPLAGPPARRGFGTRLLQRGLARDLGAGAEVDLEFNRAGLRAAIRFARPRSVVPEKEAAAAL